MTIGEDTTVASATTLRGATAIGVGLRGRARHHHHRLHAGRRRHARPTRYLVEARVEDGASLGPFAYLRPGAHVGPGAKIGTFVEVKNSEIGAGTKVPHLSYIGDADVGEGSNIGAGQHHRQLRRQGQAPDHDRRRRAHRRRHRLRRPCRHRGRGVHWRRVGHHGGCPRGRARHGPLQADQHRGIRQQEEGAVEQLGHAVGTCTRLVHPGGLRQAPDDRLRPRQPRPGLADRRPPGCRPDRCGAQDLLRRRGVLPLRRLHPRRRPVHRPVHLRLRAPRASRSTTRSWS